MFRVLGLSKLFIRSGGNRYLPGRDPVEKNTADRVVMWNIWLTVILADPIWSSTWGTIFKS